MPRRRSSTSGGRRARSTVPALALAVLFLLAVRSEAPVPNGGLESTAQPVARMVHAPGTTLSPARLARSSVSWNGGPTVASTGETVNVLVSAELPPELGTAQTWADFIAGLMHGPELSSLTAYIATFAEMQSICGEHALGCYSGNRMVSMGETMFGVTAAEVVRHEYGHHIALHRQNPPWQAISWGPKNWASAQNVCGRTAQGTAFPGDQGNRYYLNPGEAWAETYRLLEERRAGATGSGWQIIDPSFYPDETSLQAAERDVLQPWTGPRTIVLRKRFTERGKRVWTTPLATPLDGSLKVTISLPKGGLHDVVLLGADRKTVLGKGLWASTKAKSITTTVCGQRSVFVRVTQRGAFGRVSVATSAP